MGKFYGLKIKSGEMTIGKIPKLWKAATQDWLDKNGTSFGLA